MISSAKPISTALFASIHVSASIRRESFALLIPVLISYALMMLSFTSSSMAMAFCISAVSPMATVAGLWIISMDTGDTSTLVPAIAITLAADAAIPSILTVTLPL